MSAAARIAAFLALLAAIFAAAALAGSASDPSGGGEEDHAAAGDPTAGAGGHGGATAGDPHGTGAGAGSAHGAGAGTGGSHGSAASAGDEPAGLASTQGGLRIVPGATRFAAGRSSTLRFRIAGEDGATVRSFQPEQSRLMHLIVVRRDLRRYQHLHPAQGPDGGWSVRMRLPDAGVYRAFADFRTGGERHTLGIDLFVPGDFAPLELPPPSHHATTGPYDVALSERTGGELRFAVRRDGRLVSDLEPYLGARGHLVVLREGDLAYGHVHPEDASPREIAFQTGGAEPGTYRLFLQFRHLDVVRTVAFTREVAP